MLELFKGLSLNYVGERTPESYKYNYVNGQKDEVIADIYVNNYKIFYSAVGKYSSIDNATKDSVIVEMIWKCMDNLEVDKLEVQLPSMILAYIKRELFRQIKSNNYDKRKINSSDNSITFTDMSVDDESSTDKFDALGEPDDTSMLEMVSYIESLDLTENQLKYCKLALEGSVGLKSGSIANAIGISRAGAKKLRERLQIVCADLLV